MGVVGLGLELGVVLDADHEGVVPDLDDLDQAPALLLAERAALDHAHHVTHVKLHNVIPDLEADDDFRLALDLGPRDCCQISRASRQASCG